MNSLSGNIKVSSAHRMNKRHSSSSNFSVNLGHGSITQNITSCYIESISFANTQYNINNTNNTMVYNDGFVNKSFTIPIGDYEISTFIAAVESGFLAESPSIVIDFELDNLTKKIKIVSSSATLTLFDYLEGDKSPVGIALGIKGRIGTSNLPRILPNVPDISGLTVLFIDSQIMTPGPSIEVVDKLLPGSDEPIVNSQNGNIVLAVGCSSPFGYFIHWKENDFAGNVNVYQTPRNFSTIDIKLLDYDNNEIDLNGSDIHLMLRVTYS